MPVSIVRSCLRCRLLYRTALAATFLTLAIAPAGAVDWDGGAGTSWWYDPLNWTGNTRADLANTRVSGAIAVFDPAADPSIAGYQYTGVAPYVRGYSVNNPAQLNQGGFANAPALPYPSPNTNYAPVNGANDALFLPPGPTGYQNPQSSTYVVGRLTLENGANLAVNSGYLYVASNANWPAGQNFDFSQADSLLTVGAGSGTSTVTQTGGVVDMRHGGLRIGTDSAGGVSGVYDFRGGYLVAGTHTGQYGSPYYGGARTGTNGPTAGNGTGAPNNSDAYGLQMGNGSSNPGSAVSSATFISRHDDVGAIWVQTLQTNRRFDPNAKSTSTFEFHYGEAASNGDKGTTPIMVENGMRFGTSRTALDLSSSGDRRTILDLQLDAAPELVSDGLGGFKPEDIGLFRLGTGTRDGTGGISIGVGAFANFTSNTGLLINTDRQIGFLQSLDLAPNGRPVLFMENASSLTPAQFAALQLPGSPSFADRDLYITDLITRTFGGFEYTWKLSYFGSIDANGNVLSSGQGTNDIVLLGVSAIAVPEPGSMILLGTGAMGLWFFHRRRKARQA